MKDLSEPTGLNGMALANRFVRSATWEGLATAEGFATESLAKLLVDLARGNVGLINRWKSGDTARSACVSDNGYFKPALNGEGVFCTVAARKGE